MITGCLIGVGVGPGDPELLTLKAARRIRDARNLAFVAASGRRSTAREIAAAEIRPGTREINIALPMDPQPELARAAYDEGSSRIAAELERGDDVVVLCEGDPLFYGSFIQIFARLGQHYRSEIVPGVTSVSAASAAARLPLVWRSRSLVVLPAMLPRSLLGARLAGADAAVFMKVGRHLGEVRRLLDDLGLLERAIYVEKVSTPDERIMPLIDLEEEDAAYFSLILVPIRGAR